jgi:hypothetical protein
MNIFRLCILYKWFKREFSFLNDSVFEGGVLNIFHNYIYSLILVEAYYTINILKMILDGIHQRYVYCFLKLEANCYLYKTRY